MAISKHISVMEGITGEVDFKDRDYSEVPTEPTHYRMCYHRAGRDWRLRDERTGKLWLVDKYVGDINLNYLDRGSHIFHDGTARVEEVDGEQVAFLEDPQVS